MEISELQDLWNKCDLQLTAHTKVNKAILREMLAKKPLKTMNWLKIKVLYQVVASILILVLVSSMIKLRDPGVELYCGLSLLFSMSFFSVFRMVKYFSMLKSVNLTRDLVGAKQQLISIGKYKLSTTKYNLIITPPSIVAVVLVLPVTLPNIPILVFTLIFIIGSLYKFKIIAEDFSKLNEQLKELENLL